MHVTLIYPSIGGRVRAVQIQPLTMAALAGLTPFPGTPLYEEMQSQQRLCSDHGWLAPGFRWGDVVFEPKNLSKDELSPGCRANRLRFCQPASILHRASGPPNRRSLVESLVPNFLVRRDVHEKQGFPLGRANTAREPQT